MSDTGTRVYNNTVMGEDPSLTYNLMSDLTTLSLNTFIEFVRSLKKEKMGYQS